MKGGRLIPAAVLLLVLASMVPSHADIVPIAPGLYWLEEPILEYYETNITFENSTWTFRAENREFSPVACKSIYGAAHWDLFVVDNFPEQWPLAHVNDTLTNELRPEFAPGGVLGEDKRGVLILRAGENYYCKGWREGGYAKLSTQINVPEGQDTIQVIVDAAQVGGVSPVDEVQYDSLLILRVIDARTGQIIEEYETMLGASLEGWRQIILTVQATGEVIIEIEAKADGTVRVCELCTGYWDREFVGIDKVEVYSGGKLLLREDFYLGTNNEFISTQTLPPATPVITTTTETTTTQTTTTTSIPERTTTTPTYTQTTTTRTTQTTTTTMQTPQEEGSPATQQAPGEAPIPVKDGDTLTYKISIEARGPEGEASDTGELKLQVKIGGDILKLVNTGSTMDVQVIGLAVAFSSVSDLAYLAGISSLSIYVGGDGEEISVPYSYPELKAEIGGACPVLKPGADGETQGQVYFLSIPVEYKCTYSNGVLTKLEATLQGEYFGNEVYAKMTAELIDTSIEGVSTGGLNTTLIIGAIVAVLAVAGGLILLRMRH